MKPEIERYIGNSINYYNLLSISKKITNDENWAGDLLNDVLLQLYDKKEIKLEKLDDNSIKYYIVKCLTINWHSTTSPFFRKVKRESTMYVELDERMNIVDEQDLFSRHQLLDIVEMEWVEFDPFYKIVFEKYMLLGSLKKVSIDTSMSLTSIHEYVNKTKNEIKNNSLKKLENE
jgi:hypothetical protein